MKANFDFRKKILIVFFIALPFILFNSCEHLLDAPSIPNEKTVVGGAISAPTGLKASQGLKRKIVVSWNVVEGAKYYDIYFAESDTAEFKKIGEIQANSFDDAISAGRTGYFKVCAVKSDGTQSLFSSIVKGTSLAEPIISSGEVTDSSATISWFMENARGLDGQDNYEDLLKFDVVCEPKSGNGGKIETVAAKNLLKSSYEYTFENLSGAQDYQFYIRAYLETDQQSYEQSRTVDKTTLTSYMPLAPEFNATQGESAKGVSLLITLPEMVMVTTETKDSQNEKVDEPYPLYFRIFRKHVNDKNYSEKPVAILYYTGNVGKTGEFGEEAAPSASDYKDSEKNYKPGTQIVWFDDSADFVGGEKYDYMIRSYVDANYSKVLWPEEENAGKRYTRMDYGTDPAKATTAMGWKSAHPVFEVDRSSPRFENNGRELSEDKSKVVSVKFGFKTEWKDLGKAGGYKFAIKQNYKPFGIGDGKDSWLKNKNSEFFAKLDEINSYVIKFGSKESGLGDDKKGAYSYTLYVVAQSAKIEDIGEDSDKVLDIVKMVDEVLVTDDVNLPKAELTVQGGYKDKVLLTISGLEEKVRYVVTRIKMKDGMQESEGVPIDLTEEAARHVVDGKFDYEDKEIEGNCSYSYVLKAVAESGAYDQSASQTAETLGKPVVSFDGLSYDSITISFKGVLAAQKYEIKIGKSGDFGNGETFTFNVDNLNSVDVVKAEISLTDKYTVKINKPHGYDNADLAGMPADVIVTAHSDVDNAPSEAIAVNVIGPAPLDTKVVGAGENSISISWNKMEGANGYLIRRVMYDNAEMTAVAEDSECTYYYDSKNKTLTVIEGGSIAGRAEVAVSGDGENKFTLTDTYKEPSDSTEAYERVQAKISWGLPFRYLVLPISDDKGDFTFGTGKDALELAASKVAYKNVKKTDGVATWGYGLNLVADKATSGNIQNLNWERPHVDIAGETMYDATKPVIYRRASDSTGAFDLFSDNTQEIRDEDAGVKLDASYYSAFEYLVKYCSDGTTPDSKVSPPKSLLDEIASQKEKYDTPQGTMTEQNNKGYLLTIEGFTAETDSTAYYEQLKWKIWNYRERAVGPDLMTIMIQNNNISADAQEAVTITKADSSAQGNIDVVGSDITAKSYGVGALGIAPKNIVENGKGAAEANGLLKVLRDYRHSYTFKLMREVTGDDGEESNITVVNTIYEGTTAGIKTTYREITNEELVKATMLVLAEATNYASPGTTIQSPTGTFLRKGVYNVAVWNYFVWQINNYTHNWKDIPGNTCSAFITASDPNSNNDSRGRLVANTGFDTNSSKISFLHNKDNKSYDKSKLIPITITSAVPLASYSGTLEFASSDSDFNFSLKRDGKEVLGKDITDKEELKRWNPMQIGDNSFIGTNATYGWWPQ